MELLHGNPRLELQLIVELTCGEDGPEASEICAVEHLLYNCTLPIVAWSDCANVIEAYARGEAFCTSLEHAQAIHWRRVFAKLRDHGPDAYELLTLKKIKAHTTEHNYTNYNMSFLEFCGNRHADKGAKDAAIDMSERYGFTKAVKEIECTLKDHKGLVRWIAEVSTLANQDDTRDADNTPDEDAPTRVVPIPADPNVP